MFWSLVFTAVISITGYTYAYLASITKTHTNCINKKGGRDTFIKPGYLVKEMMGSSKEKKVHNFFSVSVECFIALILYTDLPIRYDYSFIFSYSSLMWYRPYLLYDIHKSFNEDSDLQMLIKLLYLNIIHVESMYWKDLYELMSGCSRFVSPCWPDLNSLSCYILFIYRKHLIK